MTIVLWICIGLLALAIVVGLCRVLTAKDMGSRAIVGDLVVFGSELKALLASGLVPLDLDYEAIDAYLRTGRADAGEG